MYRHHKRRFKSTLFQNSFSTYLLPTNRKGWRKYKNEQLLNAGAIEREDR